MPDVPDVPNEVPQADGSILDVLLLQAHVIAAAFWLLSCVLVSVMAVPTLRRLPSAGFLHELQVRRDVVIGVLWATFGITLGTGTYLLFRQAVYDPPLSTAEWDALEFLPYALPYYYALYGKIALFLLMGGASLILSLEANRAARHSEARGGPVESEYDGGFVDPDWIDEEVLPDGSRLGPANPAPDPLEPIEIGAGGATTRVATRAAGPRASIATLWASVGVLVVGAGGVGFCVTLIKYFHELARAAVVYEQLRRR